MSSTRGKYIAMRDINISNVSELATNWIFWIGLLLVSAILLITFFTPCPSESQFMVYRLILTLGLVPFITSVSSVFLITNKTLKISSTLVLFVIIYLANPTQVIKTTTCASQKHIKGIVYLAGVPLEGVLIKTKSLNESDITNGTGAFELTYNASETLQAIDLQFSYRNIDTLIHLSMPLNDSLLILKFRDTIPLLSPSLAVSLIKNYLELQQEKVTAEHKKHLLKQGSKKIGLQSICLPYQRYSSTSRSQRNTVLFENDFEKLSTQKALIQAQIPLEPMVPYHAHYLENYELFLYECDSSKNRPDSEIYLHYAFLNQNPARFSIEALNTLSKTEYLAKVSFSENIRYIRTEVRFNIPHKQPITKNEKGPSGSFSSTQPQTKYSSGAKTQSIQYIGVRPFQQYIIRYTQGQWKLEGMYL